MKITLLYIAILIVIIAAATAIGYAPTERQWGQAGVRSMWAAGAICGVAGLIAVLPIPFVAAFWPGQVGNAIFAGTAIRLLVTMPLMLAFQTIMEVHLRSFLLWMLVLYMPLMAAETALGVLVVRKAYPTKRDAR